RGRRRRKGKPGPDESQVEATETVPGEPAEPTEHSNAPPAQAPEPSEPEPQPFRVEAAECRTEDGDEMPGSVERPLGSGIFDDEPPSPPADERNEEPQSASHREDIREEVIRAEEETAGIVMTPEYHRDEDAESFAHSDSGSPLDVEEEPMRRER